MQHEDVLSARGAPASIAGAAPRRRRIFRLVHGDPNSEFTDSGAQDEIAQWLMAMPLSRYLEATAHVSHVMGAPISDSAEAEAQAEAAAAKRTD